jgi:hypothetical protein
MKKTLVIIAAILTSVIIGLIILPFLVDEPLRRYAERRLSSALPGFTVQIGKLATHPLALSCDLDDLVISQKDHPDPPVVVLPRLHAGLRWPALLTARVVAEVRVDGLKATLTMKNLRPALERMKQAPPSQVAWQDVLTDLPPFTVNEFRMVNAEVHYIAGAGGGPLSVTRILFVLRNFRNVRARDGGLPTGLSLEAVLPGSGRVRLNGSGDLLQKPFLSLRADLDVQGVNLAGFRDLAGEHHIVIKKGTVDASARVEMTPKSTLCIVKEASLKDAAIDYLSYAGPLPEEVEKEQKAETAEKAKELQRKFVDKPGLLFRIAKVRISGSTFGVVNKSAKPEYRIFMEEMDLEAHNFTNRFSEGPAGLFLRGRFMGSGDTTVSATFRPEKEGPDFDIRIAIKDTRMRSMNDLFRAYGNFDVSAGFFSLYSELTVVHNRVDGYVKPLFRDTKVYDRRTDSERGEFRRLYESIVGGVANLLKNRPGDAVATKAPIKGTVEDPQAGTWTALVNIVRNAFFQAILPGFEKSIQK